jgi:hypothetical protein
LASPCTKKIGELGVLGGDTAGGHRWLRRNPKIQCLEFNAKNTITKGLYMICVLIGGFNPSEKY